MKIGRRIYAYAKESKLVRGGKNELQKHFRFDA